MRRRCGERSCGRPSCCQWSGTHRESCAFVGRSVRPPTEERGRVNGEVPPPGTNETIHSKRLPALEGKHLEFRLHPSSRVISAPLVCHHFVKMRSSRRNLHALASAQISTRCQRQSYSTGRWIGLEVKHRDTSFFPSVLRIQRSGHFENFQI